MWSKGVKEMEIRRGWGPTLLLLVVLMNYSIIPTLAGAQGIPRPTTSKTPLSSYPGSSYVTPTIGVTSPVPAYPSAAPAYPPAAAAAPTSSLDWATWLYALASFSNGVAACLAWASKLMWSKEYREAKDEIIRSKSAEVQAKLAEIEVHKTATESLKISKDQTIITKEEALKAQEAAIKNLGAAKDETIKAKDSQIEMLKNECANLRELTPMKIREYFVSVRSQLEEFNDNLKSQLEQAQRESEEKDQQIKELRSAGVTHETDINRLTIEMAQLAGEREALMKRLEQDVARQPLLAQIEKALLLIASESGESSDPTTPTKLRELFKDESVNSQLQSVVAIFDQIQRLEA